MAEINSLKGIFNAAVSGVKAAVRDTELRRNMMFRWLNILLAFVSLAMTVVNAITGEYKLMVSTLLFGLVCVVNALVVERVKHKVVIFRCFSVEALALLAFFCISGMPEGFSALWVSLIPAFSLLVFGRRGGTVFSSLAFALIIFCFWTPWGRAGLMYDYSQTFMLRFPLFYAANFLIALFIECIRVETQRQLLESEERYRHLSFHDPLTDLYNRFGFNAKLDAAFESPGDGMAAFIILDIDDFKAVNDTYGHNAGDLVLKRVADVIRETVCEHCIYCRWGGEEFTIFTSCSDDPVGLAERLRKNMEAAPVEFNGQTISATISVGVSITPCMARASIARMVTQADQCLYEAKGRGKDRVISAVLE